MVFGTFIELDSNSKFKLEFELISDLSLSFSICGACMIFGGATVCSECT
ncbi:hypothetical protein OROGR_023118 [Orobanche gracilis]